MMIKTFEKFKHQEILIIVDVQKSFRKFFTEMYLHELKKYCKEFDKVYYIFDNHVDGKNVDQDYLYDRNVQVEGHPDLYEFPNMEDMIEKRYNYDVNVEFFKDVLTHKTYQEIKKLESRKKLKRGDFFRTKENTILVYIGNNHQWFHCPKKLYEVLVENTQNTITIVGGSDKECLEDVFITASALGVEMKRNWKYIYSGSHCPL